MQSKRKTTSVVLHSQTLATGGVTGVVLSQARYLRDAGIRVTIVLHRAGDGTQQLPEGVDAIVITGDTPEARLAHWVAILKERKADTVIEHRVLHSRRWPRYARAARRLGVPTIGWIHNFSLKPVYDGTEQLAFIEQHLGVLSTLVTLSPLDVAFWKLRNAKDVVWLPNPPSPMLLEAATHTGPRQAAGDRIELIWWGRFADRTKRISELLELAARLLAQGIDFGLTIIGPDTDELTAAELERRVIERGLSGRVRISGALHGAALEAAIDAADAFVSTSIVEGYLLTLVEAQAHGLPVLMYELPWLAPLRDNEGVVAVPQGDAAELARQVAQLREDPERYRRLSAASLDAARRATEPDFGQLYLDLLTGSLPSEYSPKPSPADAQLLQAWASFYAEHGEAVALAADDTA